MIKHLLCSGISKGNKKGGFTAFFIHQLYDYRYFLIIS
jgi:hypothetical protein